MNGSKYLSSLIETKSGAVNLQVVFVDIEKYSKRKSTVQKSVIDLFTEICKEALHLTAQKYVDYTQENEVNFATDIIKITTGDGLAVVFPFEGLQSIHLDFSRYLLSEIHKHNKKNDCERFTTNGWCNCHNNFNARIGVSEGKGILYNDLNDNYNVAGNVINIAARIMDLADGMQILFSEQAYNNLIDMTPNTTLEESFHEYKGIEVKHNLKIDVYQYCSGDDFINREEPDDLKLHQKLAEMEKRMKRFLPLIGGDFSKKERTEKMLSFFEAFGDLLEDKQGTESSND